MDLTGSAGADTFNVRSFGGTATLSGLGGDDTYNVGLRGVGAGSVTIADSAGSDKLNVTGTSAADAMTVDDTGIVLATGETIGFDGSQLENLTINAGLGDDMVAIAGFLPTTLLRVNGGGGNDAIDATGFVGQANLDGGFGADSLVGGSGNDLLLGRFGNDVLDGGDGDDKVDGGFGDDQLVGGAGKDSLLGGAGNDQIDGQDGEADFINGGSGSNVALVDLGLDQVLRAKKAK